MLTDKTNTTVVKVVLDC